LDFTLCCGQTFRWEKRTDWWYGVVGEKAFKIRQDGKELEFENVDAEFVKEYFGLHDDLPKITVQIAKDEHIRRAIQMFEGLRILHQEPWECLISYICATFKNIAAIKHMLLNLSRHYGEETTFDDSGSYIFPTPERLAKASVAELADCGLGFRAKHVLETAIKVQEEGFDFDHLRRICYEEAKAELVSFPGVGLKVADCILLFSLGKFEAFPIDVWMKRVILRHYSEQLPNDLIAKIICKDSLTDSEYKKLNLFGREYFGQYAGYAQEYLYHHERTQH
jgi:N-glycosylase/DNA lyase